MFRIQVQNQYGTVSSKLFDEHQREDVIRLLDRIGSLNHLSFNTESGNAYFPSLLLQNSLVRIIDFKD